MRSVFNCFGKEGENQSTGTHTKCCNSVPGGGRSGGEGSGREREDKLGNYLKLCLSFEIIVILYKLLLIFRFTFSAQILAFLYSSHTSDNANLK